MRFIAIKWAGGYAETWRRAEGGGDGFIWNCRGIGPLIAQPRRPLEEEHGKYVSFVKTKIRGKRLNQAQSLFTF